MTPQNSTFNIPPHCELVLASDIHIRGSDDERALALIRLIRESSQSKVQNFVLNGDIFDFFFGWGSYFYNKYAAIFSALEDLAQSGANVYFVEGNHEFAMNKTRGDGICVVDSEGMDLALSKGSRVRVIHGDLMGNDWKYHLFRRVVRSPTANILAYLIPAKLLDIWTMWFASTSRKKDRYRVLNHKKILTLAETLSKKSPLCTHLVFGHFHYPYDESAGNGTKILSVECWDPRPNCLVFYDGKVERRLFNPQT